MPNDKKIVICVGRFQPFHNGHYYHLKELIDQDLQPLVFIPVNTRMPREPFTFEQRKKMIELNFEDSAVKPILVPMKSNYQYLGNDSSGLAIFDIKDWTDEILGKVQELYPGQKFMYASGANCEKYNLKYGSKDLGQIASVESLGLSSPIFEQFIVTNSEGQVHATQIRKHFIEKDEFGRAALSVGTLNNSNNVMNPKVVDYINNECQNVLSALYHHYHSAKAKA